MNFFEHQEKARKQSKWIIAAFIGVTLLIVLAVDVIALAFMAMDTSGVNSLGRSSSPTLAVLFSPEFLKANLWLVFYCSLITGGVICFSTLGKIASLRSGGGKVANDMGGVLVSPDTRDPLRKRLYNVVEEIALASGTPVPEVFVMENEPGINAFAAGYSAADAAIAVSQGALENLSRAELQGVVAHEFSHILNGDMRINIRMMGVIFGIIVLTIIGRKAMRHSRYSSRSKDGVDIGLVIGIALTGIGYIGLFFARWIKSSLSKQREYLADASAVQFTRDPSGIGGALKKIAAHNHSSYIHADTEEVSHMLFSSGYRAQMFATHPPINDRISRIDGGFDPQEIDQLATKLSRQQKREHAQAAKAQKEQQRKAEAPQSQPFIGAFDVDSMIENIGNPEFERILAAASLSNNIPDSITSAAHSLEWAPEVLFLCLLDNTAQIRNQQLLIIMHEMGDLSEQRVSYLANSVANIKPSQRLPILEMCFPALKRRPTEDIKKILHTIHLLASADDNIDSFEYLLSSLIEQYLMDAKDPSNSKLHGNKKLKSSLNALAKVLSIVALHGAQHEQTSRGADAAVKAAKKAYLAGMSTLGLSESVSVKGFNANAHAKANWHQQLSDALTQLDELRPTDKGKVVKALATTVADDQQLITEEHELLRAICSLIHVPLPIVR